MRVPILLYHGVVASGVPGPEHPRWDPGYAVTAEGFRAQLARLAAVGLTVRDLADVAAGRLAGGGRAVILTFDDGYASDAAVVLPALLAQGIRATFFVESGCVGERGRPAAPDLRRLVEAGMEVGSHTVTHRFLPGLPDAEVRRELTESKRFLEDVTGAAVRFLSAPGGRLDRRTASLARSCGYQAVCTSVPEAVDARQPGYCLPRLCVRRRTSPAAFDRLLRAERGRLGREQLRYRVLQGLRALLGEARYGRVRERLLASRARGPRVESNETHG